MTKRLGTLLCAVLLCAGAKLAFAQDQNQNMPPSSDQTPAAAPATPATPATPAKHHHHKWACADDVKQYCPDAKGHKAINECLKTNEDKLSDACKAERAKMAKHHHKKAEQAPATQEPATPAPAPANQ